MDAHKDSYLTWTFQVKKINNLPKEVATQIEISGFLESPLLSEVAEPSCYPGPYLFPSAEVTLQRSSHLIDALCNKKLVFKILSSSPEVKGRQVIGTANVDATALIHDRTELAETVAFSLETDCLASLGLSEEVGQTVTGEIAIAASGPLGLPEDHGDWNIFSVKVQEVTNLPLSLATYCLNASQDPDSHPFTYSLHVLGAKVAGGSLFLPAPASEDEKSGSGKGGEKSAPPKNKKQEKPSKTADASEKAGKKIALPKAPQEARPDSASDEGSDRPVEAAAEDGPGETKSPALTWNEQSEVHFYRGRQFLSHLLYTVDTVGGLWVYLLPRPKREQTDERGKGSAKHGKAPPARGKTANKVDAAQSHVDTCRRFTGRAWIPLDEIRKGAQAIEGSFPVVSFNVSKLDGKPSALASALNTERSTKKSEPGTPAPAETRETFEENRTTLRIKIQLRFPLQALEPRNLPSLFVSSKEEYDGSPGRFPSESGKPANASAVERSNDGKNLGCLGCLCAWDAPSQTALHDFKACVEEGIKWIAQELSENVSLENQRLLATAAARGKKVTREKKSGEPLEGETPHRDKERAETTRQVRDKIETEDGEGRREDDGEGDGEEGTEQVRRDVLQRLHETGCYDELFRKIRRSVTLVIRDKLRKDIGLATAATTATTGCDPQTLTEDLLQQKLDKFLSETFVFLVDTMQQMVNQKTAESQSLREMAILHPANAVRLLSDEERRANGRDGEQSGEAAEALERLAFESEVVGNVERSIELHKRRIVAENHSNRESAALWFSLARLFLRHGEHRVEEAEQALRESIQIQGGPEKASTDTLLMLGSCLLHRRLYKDAETAFACAAQRCGEEGNTNGASVSLSDHAGSLVPSPALSLSPPVAAPQGGRPPFQQHSSQSRAEGNATSDGNPCSSRSASPPPEVPSQVLPFFFLSVCHYLEGNTANFEKYLAVTLKPGVFFARQRDLNEMEQKQVENALEDPEEDKAASEKGGEEKQASQSGALWAEGIFDELEQALPVFPKDAFYEPATVDYPILAFFLILLKFGLPSLCLTFVDRADEFVHSRTTKSGLFTFIKAKALFLKKDFVGAARGLCDVLQKSPRHRQALPLLAESYYRLNLVQPAINFFLQSIDFLEEPRDCVIYLRLGELMLKQKNYESAHRFYQKSLEYAATSEGWLGVAVSLYRLGNLPGALEAAMVSNWRDKDRGETWGYLALCLLSTDRGGEADMCTRFMVKSGFKRLVQRGLGALGGAVTERKVRKIDPDHLFADRVETTFIDWGGGLLVEVADAYLSKLGPYGADTATALARRALNECRGNAAAHKVLSQALACQGHYEAAVGELLTVMRCAVEDFKQAYRRKLQALYDLFYDVKGEHYEATVHAEEEKEFAEQKHTVQLKLTEAYDLCQNLFAQLPSSEHPQEATRIYKEQLDELSRLTLSSLEPGALTERELQSDL
ncbi:putative TPR domain-containing protein [Neospora caninum Liverpool]|uniref:Putative TPR domain-containing protein n=1 Tax=Neospora caninum (strain Liverpool) TaxID=572307 RepID=F0V7C1_NEOCL|nr:putative TPR domain-containing protein [Neospora caninum Liverpool]CBZ49612.1 putative TPR domain-containing protein [Neospora caninum Liverpool]CEL64193.1 TPA: TPR domain-containing protein, putative [Neospora caninum Liverpool]|eukprot:XP_003879647.1 putative TPR domain-containing protein [Neospora caninum Liverpool]